MAPTCWTDLPTAVRHAVTQHVGPVSAVREVTDGRNHDLAVELRIADRFVFLKGVGGGPSRRMRMLRNEITAGRLLAPVGLAPGVCFSIQLDGWLIVGFDHVRGRAADLAPGSPDLSQVADAVNRIAALSAADLHPLRARWGGVDWWRRLADEAPVTVDGWNVAALSRHSARLPDLADGDRLVHTDLHGEQFLLAEGRAAHVIDWGFPGRGAPWVDPAFLVLRLIEAGLAPDEAETWARHSLEHFENEPLTTWAAYLAGMWTYWAVTENEPGQRHRARLARSYLAWRLRER